MTELDPQCRAARAWISATIDGEATDAERRALASHLSGCASCQGWSAVAGSLALRIRTAEPEPLPVPSFTPAAEHFVTGPPLLPRRRRRTLVANVLGVAAVAAGIAAAVGLAARPDAPAPQAAPTVPVLTVAQQPSWFVDGRPVGQEASQRDRSTQLRNVPLNPQHVVPAANADDEP